MSVASEVSEITYAGNNSTTTGYLITFGYLEASHIKVSVKDADDVVTYLSLYQYEVDEDSDEVTTTTAYDSGIEVTIYRELPLTQPTEYTAHGPFPAATTEDSLDWRAHTDQQLDRVLGHTVRAPWDLDPIQPIENGIMGFDTLGQPTTYDQAYIRELVLAGGGLDGSGTATFANAAARSARVPDFIGQWGVQRDTGSAWIATALTAGAWDPYGGTGSGITLVTTDAELTTALLVGGKIGVVGSIARTAVAAMTVAGTELIAIRSDAGVRGGITRTHAAGQNRTIIDLKATNCKVLGLELTTAHPLYTDQYTGLDIAIEVGAASSDASDFVIDGCDIHDVWSGIYHASSRYDSVIKRGRITNNHVHSFCGSGIYFDWNGDGLLVADNTVCGRDLGTQFAITGAAVSNTFSATAHGMVAGQGVHLRLLVGGTGLLAGNDDYYVSSSGLLADAFCVCATPDGAVVDFSTDVTVGYAQARETHFTTMGTPMTVTGVAGTDLFTKVAHGLSAGYRVRFTAITGGTGISTWTTYYVIAGGLTADVFKVSASLGGGTIDFTTNLTASTMYILGYEGHGNAIWVGDQCNRAIIRGNLCQHIDRHGLEYFNGTDDGGNRSSKIIENTCEDCAFGISALGCGSIVIGHNQITRAQDIGLEMVGESQARCKFIAVGNVIDDTRYSLYNTGPSVGVSIDGVATSLVFEGNQVGKVTSIPSAAIAPGYSYGIQFWSLGNTVSDVSVRGNTFTDAGVTMIYANRGGAGTYNRYVIENNTFLCTSAYDTLYGSLVATWYAVLIDGVTLSVVRNNTSWYPSAAAKDFGLFALEASVSTTVYSGDSTMTPETTTGEITGTNLRLAY